MPTPTRRFLETFSEGYLRPDGRHTGSLGVHAEGTGCEGMGWAGLLWTQGPVLPGAVPATGFLRQSGISLDSRGASSPSTRWGRWGRWASCRWGGGFAWCLSHP